MVKENGITIIVAKPVEKRNRALGFDRVAHGQPAPRCDAKDPRMRKFRNLLTDSGFKRCSLSTPVGSAGSKLSITRGNDP
ncbi:hypothetical protein DESC_870129 [Desulfosarcina cetonica]|nr:hypothetical protein DESC_870129 [Desulfosarcina cetonica]